MYSILIIKIILLNGWIEHSDTISRHNLNFNNVKKQSFLIASNEIEYNKSQACLIKRNLGLSKFARNTLLLNALRYKILFIQQKKSKLFSIISRTTKPTINIRRILSLTKELVRKIINLYRLISEDELNSSFYKNILYKVLGEQNQLLLKC
ncbi:hypothetical protein BpHYR1_052529 [Brachionus plicatilis]|uniref:RNA-directed DNA polymerase from mobile element jockey-like n=1 Tax=Brachionus plicatilis TaxID=10195 RepID=A0A3M7PJG6_BRAPC|nr:hypothetical protein BpHYR1_052529 [Brachionus plicatilis]